MKKIFNILILILFAAFISGCEKELTSEGVSRLTEYVDFELTDGELLKIPVGNVFVDPGFKAMDKTTDVTDKVTVEGTADGTQLGLYEIKYSATNSDGYTNSVTRTVIIYDPAAPATDFSGNYLADVRRISPARAFTGLSVKITKLAPGFFYVSDLLGGFYDQGANYAYGAAYALTGYIQLKSDNSVTLVSSYLVAWGDSADDLTVGIYNPVTKALSWNTGYSGYIFAVTLTLK